MDAERTCEWSRMGIYHNSTVVQLTIRVACDTLTPQQLCSCPDVTTRNGGLMAVVEHERKPGASERAEPYPGAVNVGPIGRLGRFMATHFRVVLVGWLVVALGPWAVGAEGGDCAVRRRLGDERCAVGPGQAADRQELPRSLELRAARGHLLAIADHQAARLQEHDRQGRGNSARRQRSPQHRFAGAGDLDIPRRSYGDRPGRRGQDPERHGRRRRLAEGQARRDLQRRGASSSDGRLGDVV